MHLVRILGKGPTWRTILSYVFISILYMFRETSCSLAGESIVSIQHLVYVNLCRWPFRVQVGKFLFYLHTKRSPTQSDIYQMLYWYNWFSCWWARGFSKHVENWNKHVEMYWKCLKLGCSSVEFRFGCSALTAERTTLTKMYFQLDEM